MDCGRSASGVSASSEVENVAGGAILLQHIRDEIDHLQAAAGSADKADFELDETVKHAFVRSLEVTGGVPQQIPSGVCVRYREVPRRATAGLGDVLIHRYLRVE
jgi:uncharacterized protein with HEPN domain